MTRPEWSEADAATLRTMLAAYAKQREVMAALGRSKNDVQSYMKTHGLSWRRKTREAPADFVKMYAKLFINDLRKHYGVSSDLIYKWVRDTGAERKVNGAAAKARPIPSDFTTVRKGKTVAQLATLYECSDSIIQRWERLLGITRPSTLFSGRNAGPVKREGGMPFIPAAVRETPRDMTLEGRAADYLRRYGPVFRRNGGWWRGSTRLTGEELVQRAIRKGFVA